MSTHLPPQTPPTNASRPLFRAQALAQLSQKQYGTVVLAKNISFRVGTIFFSLIGLSIMVFFVFFSTTRKAHTVGVLIPTKGVIKLQPLQSGVVVEKRVEEGQMVKAGDVLMVLRLERNALLTHTQSITAHAASDTLANTASHAAPSAVHQDNPHAALDTQTRLSQLQKQRRDSVQTEMKQAHLQNQQRVLALQVRLNDLKLDIAHSQEQIQLQEQRIALSQENVKRYQDLQKNNYISPTQIQAQEAELLDQKQRLADLWRVKANYQKEWASTQAQLVDAKIQNQRDLAALQRQVTSLEEGVIDSAARNEFVITASQSGMVSAITAEVGQTVAPNQAIATLIPEGSELEAEIYAPSRSIGFIEKGMKVLMRYQAYPHQKFGQYEAEVREISQAALRPEELALPNVITGGNNEPLYRIRLKLAHQHVQAYGKPLPLKAGMMLEASVQLEKRRLYEWVLEPLLSVSGKL